MEGRSEDEEFAEGCSLIPDQAGRQQMGGTYGLLTHLWEISKTQGFPRWRRELSFTITHDSHQTGVLSALGEGYSLSYQTLDTHLSQPPGITGHLSV